MIRNNMEGTSQDDPRSKLGMDIFLSQHKGFRGEIKTYPEDFRVTEVDLCGKLVRLQREEADKSTLTPSDNQIGLGESDERKPGEEVDKVLNPRTEECPSTSSTDEPLIFDELTDFKEMASTLEKVVGQGAMYGLVTFSKQEFDRNEQVCPSITSTTSEVHEHKALSPKVFQVESPTTSEVHDHQALNSKVIPVESHGDDFAAGFNLGEISGKDERTFTHKAVQCLYPHLKTAATRQAGNMFHDVQVFTNPIYWEFQKLLSNPQTERVVRFACSKFSTATVSVGSSLDKKQRTSLHGLISKHFGKFLESKTCERAGTQEVVIRFRERYSQKGRGRGVKRKGGPTEEPAASGDVYTGFTLRKENLETLDALQQLGRVLKVQASDFSYAGIKDKKAVTLQSVAVKGVNQKRFHQLICAGMIRGITVGNVQPLTKAIHPGDLTGNVFDILIRDVSCHDTEQHQQKDDGALLWQELASCFKGIQEGGFVNYFGEQRFGQSCNGESQSAAIGQAILAGTYREAIKLILCPDGERNNSAKNAKRHFHETHNAKEALALMPKNKTRECIILKALHRHGLDRGGCVRALYCIPHGLRQFYIHAFCSLVWNHMASERLRLYGCKVVAGDLVLMGNDKQGTRDKIHEVSEEDVQNAVFSIQDVALPLPGNSIRYPGNRVGDAYKDYMEKVDLGSCTYRVTDLQVNIPGDYRRLVRRPEDLHWQLERSGESSGQSSGQSSDTDISDTELLRRPENLRWQLEKSGKSSGQRSDGVGDRSKTERAKIGSPSQDDECHFAGDKYPTCNGDLDSSGRASDMDYPKSISEILPLTESAPLKIEQDFCKKPDSHLLVNTRNLRIKFKLPTSTYATVFLRELMKR